MKESLKPTILSALVLALASFGDALLYPVLPLNAAQMGIPVVWVGVLLSINRFVRLGANQLFGWLFNTYGYKKITLLAAVFATLSTFAYGIAAGLWLWLLARIVWGLCYSSLRISCISYSLEGEKPGFQLGLSRGLQETGPIIALVTGPLLMQYFSPASTFMIFSALSVSAILVATRLPELPREKEDYSFSFNPIPSSFNFLVFFSGFLVEGMLVVLVGRLFVNGQITLAELTALAAIYLGYRRLSNVFISPLAGKMADRFGIERVFLAALILTVFSLLTILSGFPSTGILLTFTFQSISSALAPGEAGTGEGNRLKSIAANTTWRDLGTAGGALAGGLILRGNDHHLYILAGTVFLFIAVFRHLVIKQQLRELLIWK